MPWQRLKVAALFALLAICTALVYRPGLSGGFLLDTLPQIVNNPLVHMASLDADSLLDAARGFPIGPIGRPLATLTFGLNYYQGGIDPWGYKLVGLLSHIVTALLVLVLVKRLLELSSPASRTSADWLTAFAIAALWAIHPLQVSTVLYVVQRMETLSLTFVLMALLAYLRGRRRQRDGERGSPWLLVSALLAALGLLSKESAALFPAYTLVLECTLLRFRAQSPHARRRLKIFYAGGVVLTLLVFVGWALPQYSTASAYAGRDFTMDERLLTQLRVLPMYLGWMLFPVPDDMLFYYDQYPVSHGWLDPVTTLYGALLLLALAASAVILARRRPLFALGIGWFFAAHLLTSNVIALELVFEHRNYFALLGVLLALADVMRRIPASRSMVPPIVVGAVIVGIALLGSIRAATWGDPLVLATSLAARNPQSTRAGGSLGLAYLKLSGGDPRSPLYGMAEAEFEHASSLPKASPVPDQSLIMMAATSGQPIKDIWWDRLIRKLETRPIGPQATLVVSDLVQSSYEGTQNLSAQRIAQAFSILLSTSREPAEAYEQYGDFVARFLGDEALSSRAFAEAVRHRPHDVRYVKKLASNLLEDGRPRQALAVIDQARILGVATGDSDLETLRTKAIAQAADRSPSGKTLRAADD